MSSLITQAADQGGVLRVITAGSVDDGKSTLIGRLLFDSRAILADQLTSLQNARHKRSVISDDNIDLALLTDGLEAEREQGITIDVAYRYFATARRKFILADAPGHEQYTRNMVTGASNSDAAIVLIDACRVENGRLLEQTTRHLVIASLLGIRHLIVAVNKMDLIDYDLVRFQIICDAVTAFAEKLGRSRPWFIPISALEGANVVTPSSKTPWYQGMPLLELLESLPPSEERQASLPLRLPVQIVLRANGESSQPYRGFAGRVESGTLAEGDDIVVLPSGLRARVQRIRQFDRQVSSVSAGLPCALELDRDIDISRGDLIVKAGDAISVSREIEADLCWLDSDPFTPGKRLHLRLGTRDIQARVSNIAHRFDIRSLEPQAAGNALSMNDIARVRISLAQPLAADRFDDIRSTGCFILIDAATHQTAAAGMVRHLAT